VRPAHEKNGKFCLSETLRSALTELVARSSTPQAIALRARVILLWEEGKKNIGAILNCSEKTVSQWRRRWRERQQRLESGEITVLQALQDRPRPGAPITFVPEQAAQIVAIACTCPQEYGWPVTTWALRELREQVIKEQIVASISERQLGRILDESQIKPHKSRYWLNSAREQGREGAIEDICDAYHQARSRLENGEITLSVDEMTGVQAKERIAPDKPPEPKKRQKPTKNDNKKERRRIEFEYERHGTLCLFGGWDVALGKISGWCNPTRTEEDFVSFIQKCEQRYPDARKIHFVVDNLNTHQSEALVRYVAAKVGTSDEELGIKGKRGILRNMRTRAKFLAKEEHPLVFHYTPKHCSWMNQIEIWFSILVRKLLKSASFKSTKDLEERIMKFIEYFNQTMAKPFKWMFRGFASTKI
jgi:transposase